MTLNARVVKGKRLQEKKAGAIGGVMVTGYSESLFSLNGAKGFVSPDTRHRQ